MTPNSVLALYVAMLGCGGIALGELVVNCMGFGLVAHWAICAGVAVCAVRWFMPRYQAYRKEWNR